MDNVNDYLDAIEDLLEGSSKVPFSTKTSIDRDQFYDILDDLRMNLPVEIEKSRKIVSEHDRIIAEAESKAAAILGAAKVQSQQLVEEHEIYRQASEAGNEIIERSKKNAREYRVEAAEYADEILTIAENSLRESLDIMNENQARMNQTLSETLDELVTNREQIHGANQNY